jgi:hypothetical protein
MHAAKSCIFFPWRYFSSNISKMSHSTYPLLTNVSNQPIVNSSFAPSKDFIESSSNIYGSSEQIKNLNNNQNNLHHPKLRDVRNSILAAQAEQQKKQESNSESQEQQSKTPEKTSKQNSSLSSFGTSKFAFADFPVLAYNFSKQMMMEHPYTMAIILIICLILVGLCYLYYNQINDSKNSLLGAADELVNNNSFVKKHNKESEPQQQHIYQEPIAPESPNLFAGLPPLPPLPRPTRFP